jgi:hypothetical protein
MQHSLFLIFVHNRIMFRKAGKEDNNDRKEIVAVGGLDPNSAGTACQRIYNYLSYNYYF